MRSKVTMFLGGAALLLSASVPVLAHHAFGAEFDANRPVLLKGKVTKVEWVNPHAWIHLAVAKTDGSGGTDEWMVEGGTPNTLFRRGFTRDAVKAGMEITVEGYRAKNGANRANGRDLVLPDGSRLFMASPGTGAATGPDLRGYRAEFLRLVGVAEKLAAQQ